MSSRSWPHLFRSATAVLTCVPGACGHRRDARATPTKGALVAPMGNARGVRVSEAEVRLAAFLKGSLEISPPTETNALMSCVPDGQTDRYLTLARYRVLGSALRGDSVDAAAEVVTVAEETGSPNVANRYVTRVRIRTDTLHWVMVRDSASKKWGVCGYAKEGFGFGHYGDDVNTDWLPPSETWAHVRQLAESVYTAGKRN